MNRLFENPTLETFKAIEGTNLVSTRTDVSLLHKSRVLYYSSMYNKLYAFNVDTRVNAELCSGKNFEPIASLTGIDCGVRAVFSCTDDRALAY